MDLFETSTDYVVSSRDFVRNSEDYRETTQSRLCNCVSYKAGKGYRVLVEIDIAKDMPEAIMIVFKGQKVRIKVSHERLTVIFVRRLVVKQTLAL